MLITYIVPAIFAAFFVYSFCASLDLDMDAPLFPAPWKVPGALSYRAIFIGLIIALVPILNIGICLLGTIFSVVSIVFWLVSSPALDTKPFKKKIKPQYYND